MSQILFHNFLTLTAYSHCLKKVKKYLKLQLIFFLNQSTKIKLAHLFLIHTSNCRKNEINIVCGWHVLARGLIQNKTAVSRGYLYDCDGLLS